MAFLVYPLTPPTWPGELPKLDREISDVVCGMSLLNSLSGTMAEPKDSHFHR